MSDELIDSCKEYIEQKNASYLAKDGQVVFYASPTGRKSDYLWYSQSVTETLRIIRATRLVSDVVLKDHHLISAFQELDKVYEFAVKSRHKVNAGIFNYSDHSESSIGDEAAALIVEEVQARGYLGLFLGEVIELLVLCLAKLKVEYSVGEVRELIYKYFESAGYVIKTGSTRPLIGGVKRPAIMKLGSKPRHIVTIEDTHAESDIISKIVNALE